MPTLSRAICVPASQRPRGTCDITATKMQCTDPFSTKANFLLPTGPTCPACSKTITSGSLQTQLEVQIREFIARYYEGWTVCDDPTCDNRTRMMGVYGRRCLRNGCKGKVSFEVNWCMTSLDATLAVLMTTALLQYSDVQLYNQLRYFIYLLDSQKAVASCRKDRVGTVVTLVLWRIHAHQYV